MYDLDNIHEEILANLAQPMTVTQYINYIKDNPYDNLEMVIREDGLIQPLQGSHDDTIAYLICKRDNISYKEYMDNVPQQYYTDMFGYALNVKYGGILVWQSQSLYGTLVTPKAWGTYVELVKEGIDLHNLTSINTPEKDQNVSEEIAQLFYDFVKSHG